VYNKGSHDTILITTSEGSSSGSTDLEKICTGSAIWKTKEEVSKRGNNLSEEAEEGEEGILRYINKKIKFKYSSLFFLHSPTTG
jgi:hypothetical protein